MAEHSEKTPGTGETEPDMGPAGTELADTRRGRRSAGSGASEEGEGSSSTAREKTSGWKFAREIATILLISLTFTFLIKTFIARPFWIPSGSMEQTLNIKDRILVSRFHPTLIDLQRGDIVVFQRPTQWSAETAPEPPSLKGFAKDALSFVGLAAAQGEEYLVKRVIGMPGDRVSCCSANGKLTINGQEITEGYLYPGNPPSMVPFEVTVPEGHLWVMGDHRSNSADSRAHMGDGSGGFVPIDNVQGRAVFRFWPLSEIGTLGNDSETYDDVPQPALQ